MTRPELEGGLPAQAGAGSSVADLLTMALAMQKAGCSLIPVKRDKKPSISWKVYQTRAADPQQIKRWAEQPQTAGFALVCGKVSGGAEILDFDDPQLYVRFTESLPEWAQHVAFPVQRTGGGGYQMLYRRPNPVGNLKLAWSPAVDADGVKIEGREIGIETRGEGGYAVIPGSQHPSGNTYQVVTGGWTQIPHLTDEQANELHALARSFDHTPEKPAGVPAVSRQPPTMVSSNTDAVRRYALDALGKEVTTLESTRQGGRNDQLNVSALNLGQLVAAGALDEVEVVTALTQAAHTAGMTEADDGIGATIRSGLNKGKTQPRDLSNVGKKHRAQGSRPSSLKSKNPETPDSQNEGLPEWCEVGDVALSQRTAYGIRGGKLCALTLKKEDGEEWVSVETLADFTARIVAEVIEEDGSGEPRRVFHIEGCRPDGAPMFPPVIEVPTGEFDGMRWPLAKWGGAARVPSGQGRKDKARDAVQVLSNAASYPFRTVYQHTGWIKHPDHGQIYLTAGAVIGVAGGVEGVAVNLPGRLSAYALPDPAKAGPNQVRQAVQASLDLLTLAPDAVAVPTLGAVYRSVLGPSDSVIWTVGETGKNKTAYNGLCMAHFGPGWSRRFLPDGWNSSANALEVNAFRVKDAPFMIDDFKPAGGAAERAKMDGTASRIIQGAADGAGRSTLTADRRSRAGLYPRGTVMTTAEDLPRGHSNRARLMVVEVHRKLIDTPAKSAAYYDCEEKGAAGVYALAMAAFIRALAGNFDEVRTGSPAHGQRVRQLSPHFQGAHGRTGDAAAEVAYGWECWLSFAVHVGAISEPEALNLWERVVNALMETAQDQAEHLMEADPVDRAINVLSDLLAQGRVYLEDLKDGGQPDPLDALLCGWQRRMHSGPDGEEEQSFITKPGGVMLGWTSTVGGDTWGHFLPDALHEVLQRAVQGQGGGLLPDASKLWGNMRDRLHPARRMKCDTEGGRVRATARATVPGGERRKLITLRMPLQDTEGKNMGPMGPTGPKHDLTASDTTSFAGPNLKFYRFHLGQMGPIREDDSVLSSTIPPDSLSELDVITDDEDWKVEL